MIRAAAAALLSAAAAAVALLLAYNLNSELRFEMDRNLPRGMVTGLYGSERAGQETFAWTAARAEFAIAGLPRSDPWHCAVRVRGGRSAPLPQPDVEISVDGLRATAATATNEYQEVEVTVPVRPGRAGLALGIASSTTVVPGPSDRRALGVQLDRLVCRPAEDAVVWPPPRAGRAAMITAAAFAAAIVASGGTLTAAAGAASLIGLAQAWPLSTGVAPYGDFPAVITRLGLVLALVGAGLVKLLEQAARRRLTRAARCVVLLSVCVLFIKLVALLHPSKLVIDALFHAHRFQAVLAGNYYFTQQMPGGVSFPYAIALYLFAAPWSSFTRDHITLLRVVVSACEVVAGALLYAVIARTWADRRAGVLAVVFFHMVPLPYGLIGNANMTNAFGQAVALVAVTWAAVFRPHRLRDIAGLFVLVSLALLSHISTAALLGVTLTAAAVLSRLFGGGSLHRTAWVLLAVTLSAAAFSIAVYYGHFAEVYRTLERVRPSDGAPAATDSVPATLETRTTGASTPVAARAAHAIVLAGAVTGWPLVILAAVGAWRRRSSWAGDRLMLMIGAWGVAFLAFFAVGIFPRVDTQFERYAAEFVGRVVFATYPAIVVLAGAGAAGASRAGTLPRAGAAALTVWAVGAAVRGWSDWFLR